MTPSRRILITGLASLWGGRLAQELERDPDVETIVGVDTADPRQELERTEFVRTETDPALLVRIIRAAAIDTVVDTRLVSDTDAARDRTTRTVDVDNLRRLLSALGGAGVRKLVVKSSAEYYGAGRDAPAFFTEDSQPVIAGNPIQKELVRAERLLDGFAQHHPRLTVTVLRCALPVGGGLSTPHLAVLRLPAVPAILGFDPRWQFVHEDDVIGALAHAVDHELRGPVNVSGDGVLALSEVAGLLGKSLLPVIPPWGTLFAATQLRRVGLPLPVGVLRDLRYGRGLDNRRLKASGYLLRYTSREAVLKLLAQERLKPLLGRGEAVDRYASEVDEFVRRSPSVQARPPGEPAFGQGSPGSDGLAELSEGELLEIIPSLETETMRRLRRRETAGAARDAVLEEIDHQLGLRDQLGAT